MRTVDDLTPEGQGNPDVRELWLRLDDMQASLDSLDVNLERLTDAFTQLLDELGKRGIVDESRGPIPVEDWRRRGWGRALSGAGILRRGDGMKVIGIVCVSLLLAICSRD